MTGQFLMFAMMGAVGTAVQYLLLIALVQAAAWPAVPASAVGFAAGAMVNYALNYRYTFESRAPHRDALLKFLSVAFAGALLSTAIMWIGTEALAVHYLLAQVAATAVVLVFNFALNKLWTFA